MFFRTALFGTIIACAASLGLLLPAGAATASASALGTANASPMLAALTGVHTTVLPSAYGCNDNVCIGINGNGTTVDAIYAQVQNPFSHSVKTTGTITDNGTVIHTFPAITLGVGGTDTQTWNSPNHKFNSGDKVCAHYSGISGVPCETIG